MMRRQVGLMSDVFWSHFVSLNGYEAYYCRGIFADKAVSFEGRCRMGKTTSHFYYRFFQLFPDRKESSSRGQPHQSLAKSALSHVQATFNIVIAGNGLAIFLGPFITPCLQQIGTVANLAAPSVPRYHWSKVVKGPSRFHVERAWKMSI